MHPDSIFTPDDPCGFLEFKRRSRLNRKYRLASLGRGGPPPAPAIASAPTPAPGPRPGLPCPAASGPAPALARPGHARAGSSQAPIRAAQEGRGLSIRGEGE